MLVKLNDGITAWSALKPGMLSQTLNHGQNGIQYRVAQFSVNDSSAPYLWWTQPSFPNSPSTAALDKALKRATMEESVYLFHGTAHVPVKTRPHQVQPTPDTGAPLRKIFELALQQRKLSITKQEPPESDDSYFRAVAELPGVFVATFAPPPPIFWQIQPETGFVVQDHLDLSILYAVGQRHERYLINVTQGDMSLSNARALGSKLAFRFARTEAVMEYHEGSRWTPGRNSAVSQVIPAEWLRALSTSLE